MSERINPCEFCDTDQPQELKRVTVARQRGGQWFIFEDVPAWVCPNCGHRYFDAVVLEAMEGRMKSTPTDARPVTACAMFSALVCGGDNLHSEIIIIEGH